MLQDYKNKLYELSVKPQYELLGKEKGYSEIISEGNIFRCFQYHSEKRAQLIRDICDCSVGKGAFRKLNQQQRVDECLRLQNLQEAHMLKAQIFGAACGREIY